VWGRIGLKERGFFIQPPVAPAADTDEHAAVIGGGREGRLSG